MGRYGTIIHRGVTDDDGQGQGGGAGDLPARDALGLRLRADPRRVGDPLRDRQEESVERLDGDRLEPDRKSTRLNSSHSQISYAVFCLKKKKEICLALYLEPYNAQSSAWAGRCDLMP